MIEITDKATIPTTRTYPYVGAYNGNESIVVLFNSKQCGMCIQHMLPSRVGEYSSSWDEQRFSVLASITIEST